MGFSSASSTLAVPRKRFIGILSGPALEGEYVKVKDEGKREEEEERKGKEGKIRRKEGGKNGVGREIMVAEVR